MAVSIHDRPDTPPADEPAEVVECSQWLRLTGLTLEEAWAHYWPERIRDLYVRRVKPGESPPWAHSWYRENPQTRKLELWRYNWDSSD